MISLYKILRQVLTEAMTFRDLWNRTDQGRKTRARHVRSKQMFAQSASQKDAWVFSYGAPEENTSEQNPNDTENWQFSYKSDKGWSTTGKRWHGYVKLLKNSVINNHAVEVQDLDCLVDCDCPDYKYRWAYHNAKAGAGKTGAGSWNQNNGQAPKIFNQGPGLCKHLASLVEYLGTKIEPVAPKPEDKPTNPLGKTAPVTQPAVSSTAPKPKVVPPKLTTPTAAKSSTPSTPSSQPKIRPAVAPKTTNAPKPEDTSAYSDSRSNIEDPESEDGYTDSRGLTETQTVTSLTDKLNNFVMQNQQFTLTYED